MISDNEIEHLLHKIPNNILLVLDGAYSEYVDYSDGGISLVNKFSNIFMTRTFSKIFGLGGLRVGWGYGAKDIINILNSVRSPFNVSSLGLKMAELSIEDVNFVIQQRELNKVNRDTLRNRLLNLGLSIDKSFANFLLLRFVTEEQANTIDLFLREKGFILRKVGSYGLPNCLRLSIGNKDICERLYLALVEYFDKNE
jgi:histidinol-phosphate aminotransferase